MNFEIRTLILEDNPADAELVEYTMKNAGIKFISSKVETEMEYVKALTEFSPDLILSDYDLPRFNGAEALKIAQERSPAIPFILVTGAIGEERAIEILTSGAIDYVMKNHLSRLVPAVRRAIQEVKEREDLKQTEDELHTHRVELEMQNDELRMTQASLEEMSSKYFDLYNFAPVGYFIVDEEWTILEANLTGSQMLGTIKSQIIKKPLHVFIHPEFQNSFHLYRRKLQKSGNPETCELKLKNNLFVSIESIAVLDEEGKRTGKIRSVFTNITERKIMERAFVKELELKVEERTKELQAEIEHRKRMEETLRESEEKYRNLFNTMNEGFCIIEVIFDARGKAVDYRYLKINPSFEKQTGLHDAEGKLMRDLAPDHEAHWFEIFGKIAMTGEPLHFENEAKALNSYYDVYAYRVGKPEDRQVAIIFHDFSDRKRAEEDLQKAKDELEDKVRERTAQLTEINKSMLGEIEERKRTEKRLRSAHKNLRAMAAEIVMADERSRQHFAADLHDTVIQTIGAAKLRSQLIQNEIPEKSSKIFQELQDFISQSITQARFIMAEMSPPVLNELGFIPAMEWLTEQIENQHGIDIEFNAADGFTPLQHEIQVLLFQATREILMNVVKHAEANTAIVKVSGGKQKVRIEIKDDGKGFDKRQAFRTDVSSGGYGLFSIRERIRHFGGRLIIQSEEGKGTRLVLTAPRISGGGDSHKAKE